MKRFKQLCCRHWRNISTGTGVIVFAIIMIGSLPSTPNLISKIVLTFSAASMGFLYAIFMWFLAGLLIFGADVYKN